MSHFTHLETQFQNLFYLKKALTRLNIKYNEKQTESQTSISSYINLVISQSNGHDIKFSWNGQKYDLVVDINFWKQLSPIETFVDQIAQQYAGEVVIGESRKMGFQPVKYEQNSDGSNTLVLERWNASN